MTAVGELEARTQRRVVNHFRHQLGYRYLGDWQDRPDNRNIETDLLTRFLARRGHPPALIAKALDKLGKAAALGGSTTLTKPTARSTASSDTASRSGPGSASTRSPST